MKLCAASQFPFVCLRDCGEVVTGSTPPKANSQFWGGEIPFVTPAQLGFQPPITAADEYVTREGADRGRLLPEGAVLVCCIGSLGKTGIAGVPLISNQQINAVIFDPIQVDARYGYHAAGSLTPLLEHFAPSTTVKIVKKSAFEKFQIPLPPLSEQKRIARILDAADALRAKRRVALVQLDSLLQSTFLDMFGDPVANPMGWPEVALGAHTSKIGSGATPSGGEAAYKNDGIAFIRSMNVRDGHFFRHGLAFIDDQQAARLGGVVVEPDDVLLNITGASVARVCRAPHDVLPARVNQHVAIIRPTNGFDQRFLEQCLLFPSMKRRLLRIAGAGATREAITKDAIMRLIVVQPTRKQQDRLAAIVQSVERHKTIQRAHLAELDTLFASLQSRAFRGDL